MPRRNLKNNRSFPLSFVVARLRAKMRVGHLRCLAAHEANRFGEPVMAVDRICDVRHRSAMSSFHKEDDRPAIRHTQGRVLHPYMPFVKVGNVKSVEKRT